MVFHSLVVSLEQLSFAAVEHFLGQGVAAFLEVADPFDVSAQVFIVDHGQHVEAFEDPSVGVDRLAQGGGVSVAL